MYTKEFRDRVAAFDRMRVEQMKIGSLISKSRELKKKIKNRQYTESLERQQHAATHSMLPSKRSSTPSPPKSRTRTHFSYEHVDPNAYGYVCI